jgi:hypothetical protein
LKISDLHLDINSYRSVYVNLVPIYQNRIIFAKNLSNKIFSPPRHQDTKLNYNNSCSLCLGAFVAILSLRGVGSTLRPVSPTGWPPARRSEPTPRREAEPEAGLSGLGNYLLAGYLLKLYFVNFNRVFFLKFFNPRFVCFFQLFPAQICYYYFINIF